MGIRLESCSDSFLEKLFPEERKKRGVLTFSEGEQKYARRAEKFMHDKFASWLNLRQIPKIHASMNKASTIEIGHPDFTVLRDNRNLMIEFKVPGMKLRPEQERRIEYLRNAGNKVVVCNSFIEAIDATKEHFDL